MGEPLRVVYVGSEKPPLSLVDDDSLTVTALSGGSEWTEQLEAGQPHCVVATEDFETVRTEIRDLDRQPPIIFEVTETQQPPLDHDDGPVDIARDPWLLAHRVRAYASEFRRRQRLAAERDHAGEIIETMPVGLLVVDSELRIRRINDELQTLFTDIGQPVEGTPVENLFEEAGQPTAATTDQSGRIRALFAEITDTASEQHHVSDHLWIDTESGQSCYEISVTNREHGGYVVLVRDVTATKRREEELRERESELEQRTAKLETQTAKLEYQNERLDKFAGIVSHDLRNPLNVASGRLELLARTVEEADDPTVDSEDIEQIQRAHGRMSDIIDEALTLAREGKAITETERTQLTETARQAWANVETEDASLELCDPVEIDSDPERLQTVFENLFRNSVEHGLDDGTESLTVSLGLLEDGFFVEDTGPGIPEEDREQVFEEGFTTEQSGTGFGLAIVRDVVRAHGWEIAVTEGSDGGARFEIRGVNFALTSGDLIDQLAEPLGNKKATELVDGALTELEIDQTRFDHETAQRVLGAIADHEGESSLVTVAAETAKRKLDC
ncbi:ATP-binding protein [Halovenus sp. HT40]|uniref:ATP-binding protein n=1 Tax=Halovenus sp. HT40 TaxID=3126691 RepID=UPI00300F29DD